MHSDSRFKSSSSLLFLPLLLAAASAIAPFIVGVNALLIPPEVQQAEVEALQYYNQFIEQLHEQSGDYHARFRELAFQQPDASRHQVTFVDEGDDDDDNDDDEHGRTHHEGKQSKSHRHKHKNPDNGGGGRHDKRVPVILGVMSKCPDAEICESVFDKTLSSVSDLVDLKTVYIGQLNKTSGPYGVKCMHGGSECDGNVQQLCVRDNQRVNQREWWNFIQCQNFQDLNRVGDISLAKQCAKVIGKDWDDDFSDCYTGARGARLLRDSVKEAHSRNITKSCSILINDKLACIHDGTWTDCPTGHEASDFQHYIEKEYKAINGKAD